MDGGRSISDIRALHVAIRRLNRYGFSLLASYGKFLLTEPDCVGPTEKVRGEHHLTLEEAARMILRIHYAAYALSHDGLVLLERVALNLREAETLCEDPENAECPAQNVITLNQKDFECER